MKKEKNIKAIWKNAGDKKLLKKELLKLLDTLSGKVFKKFFKDLTKNERNTILLCSMVTIKGKSSSFKTRCLENTKDVLNNESLLSRTFLLELNQPNSARNINE